METIGTLINKILEYKVPRVGLRLGEDPRIVYEALTAGYIATVMWRGCVYQNDNGKILNKVALLLSGAEGKKNCLMFCGKCGNGKSTMAAAYIEAARILKSGRNVVKIEAREVGVGADYVADVLILEDLGEEPREVQDYGTPRRPCVELIENRYRRAKPFIITTNLTPKEIGERYGERVRDRLQEVCEIVIFEAPSYRQK